MIPDGAISADHLHVADLAFACVPKGSVRTRAVMVAIKVSAFTGNEQNHGSTVRGADAALSLAAYFGVDVAAAIRLARNKIHPLCSLRCCDALRHTNRPT